MGKKSPFAQGFLGVDLYYDAMWNTVGADLDQSGVRIHHGATSEGGESDVSSLEFTLTNPAGKYNPRNPSSPLAGKIGRNTPARSTLNLGAPWIHLPMGATISAPDSAGMSTTGDLDLRWWGQGTLAADNNTLMQKWISAGNQRSWALMTQANGKMTLFWSTTGANQISQDSTAVIPAWAGTVALRATLDVDNGAGGHTVTFYYAKDLDGPWTRLGEPVVTPGTTSTFDSTAFISFFPSLDDMKLYGYEIRHGIDALPASSFRFSRGVPGYRRTSSTARRTNLFHDGRAGGSYALGQQGGTFQRSNGEFVLTKTAAVGTAAYGALRGVAPTMLVNTVHTVRFDYKFSGGVSVYYRPGDSFTSTTGQVNLTTTLNLIQDGEWHTTSATFTTTATAPGSNSAGIVLTHALATATGVEARVRNVIIRNSARTTAEMGQAFDGWDTNTPTRFYYWTAAPYASPAAEYEGVADSGFFADDQARFWTIGSQAELSNRHVLATCEVAEWPVDWNTKGAPSVMTTVQANGVSRRMAQGAQPVDSAIFRSITNRNNGQVRGYWPMEEPSGLSDRGFSATVGERAGWQGAPSLAAYSGFAGSKPIPVIGDTRVRFRRSNMYANTGAVQVRFLMHQPDGGSDTHTICEVSLNGGGITVLSLLYTAGNLRLIGKNNSGDSGDVQIFDTGAVAFDTNGKNLRVGIQLTQNGSTVDYKMQTLDADGIGLSYSGSVGSQTFGSVKDVLFNPSRKNLDVAIGHVTMESATSTLYDIPQAVLSGYPDEAALVRLKRNSTEAGVVTQTHGFSARPKPMGPQETGTLLELLSDAARADGGLLHDDPEDIQLRHRSLESMYSQPPVVIPYQDNLVIPFAVSDDDALTRNKVTVQNPAGEFAVSEVSSGSPLSSQPTPAGVGLYDTTVDVNLSSSGDTLQRAADWGTHVGTWDEARYPTLGVDLAHPYFLANPVLTRQLLAMVPGDRLVIQNPPPWLPPRSVDVLVMGINYDIDPWHAKLTWTCVPARPYRAGYWNAGHRWSGDGTVTSGALTTTATTFGLALPQWVTWTSADGQYDIDVNGEIMTVTNVSGGNTMTVIRSVNGVVKSHPAGSAVRLADPSFYAR